MNEKEFIEQLKKLNIEPKEELEKLNTYYLLLKEWNKKMNLTSIIEKDQVYLKHFYDSLTIVRSIDLTSYKTLCDIGTGAGFPGIVLKIFYPNLEVTLVDALEKRVTFLQEVIKKLNLKKIDVYHVRMEEFSKMHEEEYDIITARAVSHLSNLTEYSAKALKIKGKMVFLKGNIEQEIEEGKNAFKNLNLKIENIDEFTLPNEESKRTIITLEKYDKTPKKYPRKYSEIKKNRL